MPYLCNTPWVFSFSLVTQKLYRSQEQDNIISTKHSYSTSIFRNRLPTKKPKKSPTTPPATMLECPVQSPVRKKHNLRPFISLSILEKINLELS